jgi:hypothetical protein
MSIVPLLSGGRTPLSVSLPSLVGSHFGRLTLLAVGEERTVGQKGRHARFCPFRCDCGQEILLRWDDVRSGRTMSCGCHRSNASAERRRTHGDSTAQLYKCWRGMCERCTYARHRDYKNYGGRGITVCDEWQEYPQFKAWCIANGYAPGLQIDRIDNNKGYSPDNCRWVDCITNSRNTRQNVWVTAFGESKVAAAWAEDARCVCSANTLRGRLRKGWHPEDAITKTLRPSGRWGS